MKRIAAFLFALLTVVSLTLPSYTANPPRRGKGGEQAQNGSPSGTLPVLYIITDSGKPVTSKTEYVAGRMKIILTDETAQYTNAYTENSLAIEIRGRGNSTWGLEKKPYKIKLSEKADLFGMGENKNWILLANAMDASHLRNKLSYDYSGTIGLNYIKTTAVELVFNGEYVGVYQLCENIGVGPERVNIFDWGNAAEKVAKAFAKGEGLSAERERELETELKNDLSWVTTGKTGKTDLTKYYDIGSLDITGGYILELDEYYDEFSKFTTKNDVPMMIHDPEYLATNGEMFGYIQDYIQDMEDALFSENGYNSDDKHYTDYIDMESFVNYWIVNEAFKNVELLYKSNFMYKDVGGKLVFGPLWDMDWSSANHSNMDGDVCDPTTWTQQHSPDREYWCKAIYDDPWFIARLEDRWWETRAALDDTINSILEQAAALSAAAEQNIARWGENGGWSFEKETGELESWMRKRAAWLDKQLSKREPNIWGLGLKTSDDIIITLTDSSDTALKAQTGPRVSPEGVEYRSLADCICEGGEKIKVKIKITDGVTKKAEVYLNSKKYASLTVESGAAVCEIPLTDLYPASSYRRNVILVKGYLSNGTAVTGNNYATLNVTGEASAPAASPQTAGGGTDKISGADHGLNLIAALLIILAAVFAVGGISGFIFYKKYFKKH